jgi:hypothetical protein
VPPQPSRADIDALLNALDSDTFKVRHEARTKLERLVFLPDVAEAMQARLEATSDREVRESLAPPLAARREMLVMVWTNSVQAAPAPDRPVQHVSGPDGWYPCLYIGGDGSFVYEAASVLFARKVLMPSQADVRTGRLTGEQLWAAAEMVRRIRIEDLPAVQPSPPTRGIRLNVMLYLRFPHRAFLWGNRSWALEEFLHPDEADADLHLAAFLCDLLASCASGPYDGPMGLCLGGAPTPPDLSKLPEWPAQAVGFEINDISKRVVYPLSPEQLPAVREALRANPLYRSGNAVLRPFLVPYVRQAMAIRLGHEPAE